MTLADTVAFELHEAWRRPRLQADGTYEPRWKKIKDEKFVEDVKKQGNLPAYVRVNEAGEYEIDMANACYFQLSEDWKGENKAAAEVVASMVETGKDYTDAEAGEIIHNAWLERNSWAVSTELGVPFSELPADEQEKDLVQYRIAKTMSEAKEYNGFPYDLDTLIKIMETEKAAGRNTYIKFNDTMLYSMYETADTCYLKVTGETKEQYKKAMEEWRRQYEERQAREKAQAEANIPVWYKRGREIIFEERWGSWYECVKGRAHDLYNGADLVHALEIMEALHAGKSIEEVSEIFNQANHSGASESMVLKIVANFSERGPEFYRHNTHRTITPEDEKLLEKLEWENGYYAQQAEKRPEKYTEIHKKMNDKMFEK